MLCFAFELLHRALGRGYLFFAVRLLDTAVVAAEREERFTAPAAGVGTLVGEVSGCACMSEIGSKEAIALGRGQ